MKTFFIRAKAPRWGYDSEKIVKAKNEKNALKNFVKNANKLTAKYNNWKDGWNVSIYEVDTNQTLYISGFLEVNHYKDKGYVAVTFCGNMGARLEQVHDEFEDNFGLMTFDRLRFNATKETGTPDYFYNLEIPEKIFFEIVDMKPKT